MEQQEKLGFYPRQTIETIDGTCEFNVLIVSPSSSMGLNRTVIISDIPHSPTAGITGHMEQIVTEVRRKFLLSPFRTTWVEHQYPNQLWGSMWWVVDFTWDMPQVTHNPSWVAYCGNWQKVEESFVAGLLAPHYELAKRLMDNWLAKHRQTLAEGEAHVSYC